MEHRRVSVVRVVLAELAAIAATVAGVFLPLMTVRSSEGPEPNAPEVVIGAWSVGYGVPGRTTFTETAVPVGLVLVAAAAVQLFALVSAARARRVRPVSAAVSAAFTAATAASIATVTLMVSPVGPNSLVVVPDIGGIALLASVVLAVLAAVLSYRANPGPGLPPAPAATTGPAPERPDVSIHVLPPEPPPGAPGPA
ncbi:hypothetical protein [Amycolatopsis samaneae]|uniref:Uncharacterized protein n=1 Tax=Amycolatopsis samaneae TaxID=664691 RepID=A0ABW5GTI3_9PSEU